MNSLSKRLTKRPVRKNPNDLLLSDEKSVKLILESVLESVLIINHEGRILDLNAAAEKAFGYTRAAAIGKEMAELIIPPRLRDRHRSALKNYLVRGEHHVLNKRVELDAMRADGSELPVEVTVMRIGADWPPLFVGFVRDVSERRRSEREIERHRWRATALHEINLAISSSLDLKTVLNLLLEKIDALLPYSVTTVRLLNRKNGQLERLASRNFSEEEWQGLNQKPGRGLGDIVLETKQPLVVVNAQSDPRTRDPKTFREHGLVSYLGCPLIIKDEAIGVIAFYTKIEHHFSDDEIEFLSSLAGQATVAIYNSQLYEEVKKQRDASLQSEERFKIVARATNDAVWDWDLLKDEAWVNDGYVALFGFNPGRVSSVASWYECIHPDDRDRVIKGIRAVIDRGGEFWSDEYRLRRFDGVFAYVFDRGYVIHDDQGKPIRMIGAIMDISDRKRAEERLAQSEARLRTIIASEPECVKLLDREGNVLEMNPAGLAMIEADSSSEVLGNSVYPMVAPEYRQVFKELQESVFQGNSGKLEFEVIGLKGTRRWLESHAVPVRDQKGNITASLSITRDISERKRLQRKILEISEQERQRLGQDLHDQLGQSLAGIALLTKGLQRKLSLRSLPEAIVAGHITELVNQAIVRTRGFVRGLLPVEPITQGLTSALEQLAAHTETVFGVCCQLECQGFVESQDNVLATHLFRIAQEAVANAVNHGKPRRVLIGLHQSNGQSLLTVSDDGIGIPKVMEYSHGMGLHMMKYRAEMIGGVFDIRRQDGGGTIVTCSFQTQENQSGAKS